MGRVARVQVDILLGLNKGCGWAIAAGRLCAVHHYLHCCHAAQAAAVRRAARCNNFSLLDPVYSSTTKVTAVQAVRRRLSRVSSLHTASHIPRVQVPCKEGVDNSTYSPPTPASPAVSVHITLLELSHLLIYDPLPARACTPIMCSAVCRSLLHRTIYDPSSLPRRTISLLPALNSPPCKPSCQRTLRSVQPSYAF